MYRIRSYLRKKKVINDEQCQELNHCPIPARANSKFKEFLEADKNPQFLLKVAKALEEAPETTHMNKQFAKSIKDFLLQQPGGTVIYS